MRDIIDKIDNYLNEGKFIDWLKDVTGINYHKELTQLIDGMVVAKSGDIKKQSKKIDDFVEKYNLSSKERMRLHKELDREIQLYDQRR